MAKQKLNLLKGQVSKPTNEKGLRDSRCLQSLIVQWILNNIDPSIKKTLPYFEEAQRLWDVLKKRFNFGNGPCTHQIKKAMVECQQPSHKSIAEYFGNTYSLWDETTTYNPLPYCKCDKCTCDIGVQLQARLNEDRLQDFLFGINVDLYGHMRSTILSYDPLPSLDRAYQMFLQEKHLHSEAKIQSEQAEIRVMAMTSHGYSGSIRDESDKISDSDSKFTILSCTYFQRHGHEEAHCWTKNGYSKWRENRPSHARGRGYGNRGGRGTRNALAHNEK